MKTDTINSFLEHLQEEAYALRILVFQSSLEAKKLCDAQLKLSSWWFTGVLEETQGSCSVKQKLDLRLPDDNDDECLHFDEDEI